MRFGLLLLGLAGWAEAAVSINTQPASKTIVRGESVTLTVAATGDGPLTYAWYQGSAGDTSKPVAGALAASYTTASLKKTTDFWVRIDDGTGAVNSAAATVTVVTTRDLIQKGFDYLLAAGRQQANGSWDNEVANTSMVALALLNAGYKEDPVGTENPGPLSKAIQFILTQLINQTVTVDGQSVDGAYVGYSDQVYRTAMVVMTLVATRNSDYLDEITKLRNWLLYAQSKAPGNAYDGAFTYGVGGAGSGDLSNSQWGYFGLRAAEGVLKDGKGELALHRALTFIDNCRGPSGAGYYLPNYPSSFDRCMTSALVWSYALAGIGPEDDRVKGGLNWLTTNYSWDYGNARYYNIVTFSKALVMSHKTKLGNYDWFTDMTRFLLDRQEAAGSWVSGQWLDGTPTYGQNRSINTAWAILAMQTRTLPENVNATMSIILASHSDAHLYDVEGRHVGANYGTGKYESLVPDAFFKLVHKTTAEEIILVNGQDWPADLLETENYKQVIGVPLTEAGTYRIEVVGTGAGPFELTIQGLEDGQVVTEETQTGTASDGMTLSTNVTVSALEGSTTLLYEPLRVLPTLDVSPLAVEIDPTSTAAQSFTLSVKEIGGSEDLAGVNITATDIGSFPGNQISFRIGGNPIPAGGFTVPKGTTVEVEVSLTLPAALALPIDAGTIRVETAGGGTKLVAIGPKAVFTLSPATAEVPGEGANGSFGVTAVSVSNAFWSAVSDSPWLAVTSGAFGTGSGTVNYTAAANAGPARTGLITVADQTFTVTQAGSGAVKFFLAPAEATYTATGGTGYFNVYAVNVPTAAWTAAVKDATPWVTITAGASGNGNGIVQYTVAPNQTADQRLARIEAGKEIFTITQTGLKTTSFTLSPTSGTIDFQGGSLNLTVTATPNIPVAWSTQVVDAAQHPWVAVSAGATGSGSGNVSLTVGRFNRTAASRHATLWIAGQTYTVTQTGIQNQADYFTGLQSAGINLYDLAGFGRFSMSPGTFWIWHTKLGWEWMDGPGGDTFIMYDRELDWSYTGPGIYPYLFRFRDGLWYFFWEDYSTPDSRLFARWNGTAWENYQVVP